jgi:filamentous hemagglutinin
MATFDSSNITNGNTVEPNDLLQLYDALTSGGGTTGAYSVSISGSITGSASTATSASFATSASRAVSSSFATTASFALNGGSGGSGFPFSGSAVITGSLLISGSGLTVTGSVSLSGSLIISGSTNISGSINLVGSTPATNWVATKEAKLNWSSAGSAGNGYLAIPLAEGNSPVAGAMYVDVQSDPRTLYIYDGFAWRSVALS